MILGCVLLHHASTIADMALWAKMSLFITWTLAEWRFLRPQYPQKIVLMVAAQGMRNWLGGVRLAGAQGRQISESINNDRTPPIDGVMADLTNWCSISAAVDGRSLKSS